MVKASAAATKASPRRLRRINGSLLKRARLWVAMGEEQRRC
jgi:hypothetical protein